MAAEKSLEDCTVKELREIARKIEGIGATSSMKKNELINAISAKQVLSMQAENGGNEEIAAFHEEKKSCGEEFLKKKKRKRTLQLLKRK